MNKIFIILLFQLFFTSSSVNATIYKCKDSHGKTTYNSKPCEDNQASKVVEINEATTSNNTNIKTNTNSSPAGRWVNDKKMTAYISESGSFQMTDISGGILNGNWKIQKNSTYKVTASFNGMSIPVNMKYDKSEDLLYLSKPGFPNTLVKYSRN